MFRQCVRGALALALAAPLPFLSGTASAQPGYYNSDEDIIVTGPQRHRVGRSAIGAPIDEYTAQSVVQVNDLNLRTASGRRELHYRVMAAARDACDQIDDEIGASSTAEPSDADCRMIAAQRAQWQVDRAIDLAYR
jgi:UrcA family protein